MVTNLDTLGDCALDRYKSMVHELILNTPSYEQEQMLALTIHLEEVNNMNLDFSKEINIKGEAYGRKN